jgi:hypothetical protein
MAIDCSIENEEDALEFRPCLFESFICLAHAAYLCAKGVIDQLLIELRKRLKRNDFNSWADLEWCPEFVHTCIPRR